MNFFKDKVTIYIAFVFAFILFLGADQRHPFLPLAEAGEEGLGRPNLEIQDCENCPILIPLKLDDELYIGKYEVTFEEWNACVSAGYCAYSPHDEGWARGMRPVINVSWVDVQIYLEWLSNKTGYIYRLPTNAEWELAAGENWATPLHPENQDTLCTMGNFLDLSLEEKFPEEPKIGCSDGFMYTSPVGSFRENINGIFDIFGNVWEWVSDCSEEIEAVCQKRAMRGASWGAAIGKLPDAMDADPPDMRFSDVGFRVVREN